MSKQWYFLLAINEENQSGHNYENYNYSARPGDVVGWLDRNKESEKYRRYRAFLFPQMTEVTEAHVNMRIFWNPDPTMDQETKAEEST